MTVPVDIRIDFMGDLEIRPATTEDVPAIVGMLADDSSVYGYGTVTEHVESNCPPLMIGMTSAPSPT